MRQRREAEMHLFGDASEPHMTHFEAERERGYVAFRWDVRKAPAVRWRVLRSEHDFAETADALDGSGQTLVSDSEQCGANDGQIVESTTYFYAVFAQDEQGAWRRQVKIRIDHGEHLQWRHASKAAFEEGSPAEGYYDPEQVAARELYLFKHHGNQVGLGQSRPTDSLALSPLHRVPEDV